MSSSDPLETAGMSMSPSLSILLFLQLALVTLLCRVVHSHKERTPIPNVSTDVSAHCHYSTRGLPEQPQKQAYNTCEWLSYLPLAFHIYTSSPHGCPLTTMCTTEPSSQLVEHVTPPMERLGCVG